MNDSRPQPLRNRVALVEPGEVAKRLRMRAERNLVQIPVALVVLVVERIREIVDVRQLHEFAQRVADDATVFHFANVAVVGEVTLPPGEETRVVDRSRERSVNLRHRLARPPLLLKCPVVYDRISAPPPGPTQ